jgi:2-phosphosulfolactate phosphatase
VTATERILRVHNLPRQVSRDELVGSIVIVIDLLRATSTICQAIASGARDVVPFLEIDEAVAAANTAGREGIVLGGERKGGKISGFALGNSPCEYTPDAVRGRRVFITTTNGTRALEHARLGKRVICGAFLNLSAVVASVQDEPRVDILCAGTDGHDTREDILAAGAIVHSLRQSPLTNWHSTDAAAMAAEQWTAVLAKSRDAGRSVTEQLAIELRDTQGGRNLLGMGLERDLVDCAQLDRLTVVPELNVAEWRITSAQQ